MKKNKFKNLALKSGVGFLSLGALMSGMLLSSNAQVGATPITVSTGNYAPAMEDQVIMSDVDNPLTLQYILSNVHFVDEIDGNIEEAVVSDGYSAHKNTVGQYTITVSGTDTAGNVGYGNIIVFVTDKSAPVITGTSTYTSNMSSPISESTIRAGLSATDNVDSTLTITKVTDNFTGNEQVKGAHTITYSATDTAGNVSAIYTVTVTVVDDIKPVISVKSGCNSTFTTSYKNQLSLETIKADLQITDNADSNLTFELVEDLYTANKSTPGTYTVKFRTTDTAGNISDTFTVTVNVTDTEAPVFYTNGLFVGVTQANTLSHSEIVDILVQIFNLNPSNQGMSYTIMSSDYDVAGFNSVGMKKVVYALTFEDGTTAQVESNIKVLGEVQEEAQQVVDENTEVEDKEETEEKEESAIARFFKNVGEFFVKLFRSFIKYICFGWAWDKDGKFEPNWKNWN